MGRELLSLCISLTFDLRADTLKALKSVFTCSDTREGVRTGIVTVSLDS